MNTYIEPIKDFVSTNLVVAEISKQKNSSYAPVYGREILFCATLTSTEQAVLWTPRSKYHKSINGYWIDITISQKITLEKYDVVSIAFRLEGRYLLFIKWDILRSLLIPNCMKTYVQEEDRWQLYIHENDIEINGNKIHYPGSEMQFRKIPLSKEPLKSTSQKVENYYRRKNVPQPSSTLMQSHAGKTPATHTGSKTAYNTIKNEPQFPKIFLIPSDWNQFKRELIRTKRAKRTFYFKNGLTKIEMWNAKKFDYSSNLMFNITTGSTYRQWRKLGIEKVVIEIIESNRNQSKNQTYTKSVSSTSAGGCMMVISIFAIVAIIISLCF
jgi:hypothetical protein